MHFIVETPIVEEITVKVDYLVAIELVEGLQDVEGAEYGAEQFDKFFFGFLAYDMQTARIA